MLNQATSGEVQNFAGIHPTRSMDSEEEETEGETTSRSPGTVLVGTQANMIRWAQAMKDSMLKEFGHFDPEVVRMISYAAVPLYVRWARYLADMPCSQSSHVKCWPLYFHEPLPRWFKGRVVLTGDAAHPVCQNPHVLS